MVIELEFVGWVVDFVGVVLLVIVDKIDEIFGGLCDELVSGM